MSTVHTIYGDNLKTCNGYYRRNKMNIKNSSKHRIEEGVRKSITHFFYCKIGLNGYVNRSKLLYMFDHIL